MSRLRPRPREMSRLHDMSGLSRSTWDKLIWSAEGHILHITSDALYAGTIGPDEFAPINLEVFCSGGICNTLFGPGTNARWKVQNNKHWHCINNFLLAVLEQVGLAELGWRDKLQSTKPKRHRVRRSHYPSRSRGGTVSAVETASGPNEPTSTICIDDEILKN